MKYGGYAGFHQVKANQSSQGQRRRLSYQESAERLIHLKQYNEETGLTESTDIRLAVVRPTQSYMPTREDATIYSEYKSVESVRAVLAKLRGTVAVDIETRGTQAADPDCILVGIGMADSSNILYFDFKTNSEEVNQAVLDWLCEYEGGFVGHNVLFDGAFLQRYCGKWLNWTFDTYGLYKQLSNEGYNGQKWGLKDAQINLLNWDTKGDVELDAWLVAHGFISSIKKKRSAGYPHRIAGKDGEPRWAKAQKGEMWQAPADILGFYCALDAASTWQLLHEVFLASCAEQPWEQVFLDYHRTFLINTKLLAEQQLTGITIDKDRLEAHHAQLLLSIDERENKFFTHPSIKEFNDQRKAEALQEIKGSEPEKYKKGKTLGKEPPKLTKKGDLSKVWLNWQARKKEIESTLPEVSKRWEQWNARHEAAMAEEKWINLGSSQQMTDLFYDHLGYPVKQITKSGAPSTGAKALPQLGEVGQLLKAHKDLVKEETYVSRCREMLLFDGTYYRIHPQFRSPGTLTCRLAGSGGLNLQQLPKSAGYLECWRPMDPDRIWIDFDVCSLEQVVMAELSRDPALLSLYGPNAKPGQDVYLFNGSQLPVIGEKIKEAGYDPFNFTAETVAKTKKVCKKERGISKVITLGSSYGAGPGKIRETLEIQGVDITSEEAKEIHAGYWRLYKQVKEYGYHLEREWKTNGGWVLNGIGRPVGCHFDMLKDVVNRVVQSTGHDILMMIIAELDRLREERGVQFSPIIIDFHDESLIECHKDDEEKVLKLFKDAYDIVNRKLDGLIPIREDGGVMGTLAEAKLEAQDLENYRNEMMED